MEPLESSSASHQGFRTDRAALNVLVLLAGMPRVPGPEKPASLSEREHSYPPTLGGFQPRGDPGPEQTWDWLGGNVSTFYLIFFYPHGIQRKIQPKGNGGGLLTLAQAFS